MQTAAHYVPALRQSTAKRTTVIARRALLVAAFCSLISATTLRAEPPVLKLAMVRPNDLPVRSLLNPTHFIVNTGRTPAVTVQPVSTTTEPSFRVSVEPIHLSLSLLERRAYSSSVSLLSTRRNLSELGRSKVWACLETGYGQLFEDRSPTLYGRNGAAWEEPSCGYFKLSFSF